MTKKISLAIVGLTFFMLLYGICHAVSVQKLRIMVIIPEEHISRPVPDPAGETEIIRKLVEYGFTVVDQKQVAMVRQNQEEMQRLRGNVKAAAALGLQYGADIIIFGEAFSESVPGDWFGMRVCRARVEARAVKCDTGVILAAHGLEASGRDVAEFVAGKKALRAAGSRIADYFIEQILPILEDEEFFKTITLTISGIEFTQLTNLKKFLKYEIKRVEDVEERSYQDGLATLVIDFHGDSSNLAEDLVELTFDDFSLSVINTSANRLDLEVGPPGQGTIKVDFPKRKPGWKVYLLFTDASPAHLTKLEDSIKGLEYVQSHRISAPDAEGVTKVQLVILGDNLLNFSDNLRNLIQVLSADFPLVIDDVSIKLRVTGTTSAKGISATILGATHEQIISLEKSLKQIRGVRAIELQSFLAGKATLDVDYIGGDANDLVEELIEQAAVDFDFDAEVSKPNELTIIVKTKP